MVIIFTILILSGFVIPAILFHNIKLKIRIVIISIGVILSLLSLFYFVSKIVLIKDIINKKIIIKFKNYFCFAKNTLKIDIENLHFDVIDNQNPDNSYFILLIINDYKNLVEIDLDESNLKKKPTTFLYSFINVSVGNYNYKNYAKILNDFVGSPTNYKNPLYFNIYTYLKKNKVISQMSTNISKYMKFNDHFFSYLLIYPLNYSPIFKIITIFTVIFNVIFFSIILNYIGEEKEIKDIIILLISIFVLDIIMYILYKFLKFIFDNIDRIDCIYSNDYDRIFIGLVKYTKTKYVKTFEYQMDNISKFVFEKELNGNNISFNLNVVFKNNEKQQILTLKNKNQDELEGLIYLLNERLINNKGSN